MNSKPLVSVIIPVFNCEKYVAAAIDSALAQTYAPLEIIVANDGSTDGTQAVLDRYAGQIKCFQQPNGGISAARNLALQHASGTVYAFLDADDLWEPQKIELQMNVLFERNEVDAVFGGLQNFASPDLDPALQAHMNCSPEVIPTQLPSTMLVRRSAFEKVGAFSAELRRAEGIDWYARAQDKGLQMVTLSELLTRRRIFKTAADAATRQEMSGYAHALKRALDRRRAATLAASKAAND